MATLKDLSQHLNLSVTQISRALNDHSDVSADTKARVREVAKALNYHPNMSARRLATGRSNVVALVLPSIPQPPSDQLFVQVVGGMSRHFARHKQQFILHIADEDEDIIDVYARLIGSGAIDGFVLMESETNDRRIRFLRENSVPFVLHGRDSKKPDYPYFDIDNFGVARQLTAYLAKLGHKRIGFLNGPSSRTYADDRLQGFKFALAEAGLKFEKQLYAEGTMGRGFGLTETVKMLSHSGPRPTALIAGSTYIAKGIYQAAEALRISIPDDLSVVGHDDQLPGIRPELFAPNLTCTQAPLSESWQPLAEFLMAALNGDSLKDSQKIGEVVFVERNSAGPPKT